MDLVTRAEWGAKPPRNEPIKLPWSVIDNTVVHYTASFTDELPDYRARVRNIQTFHMNRADPQHGWNDIAYNFLFAKDGSVYEGRGWNVMSAATLGHNDHTVAFCFLGSDKTGRDDVTNAGRQALKSLVLAAIRLKGFQLLVKGHKDFFDTECPGSELYNYINTGWWKVPQKYTYPPKFFQFAAWYLGEGSFKQYGPRDKAHRPVGLPSPYEVHKMAVYYAALAVFLRNRKKV